MIAKLVGQNCFGGFWLSVGMVAPPWQFISDELEAAHIGQFQELDRWFEPARLGDDWGICEHHVAQSEAHLPEIGQGLVGVTESHRT